MRTASSRINSSVEKVKKLRPGIAPITSKARMMIGIPARRGSGASGRIGPARDGGTTATCQSSRISASCPRTNVFAPSAGRALAERHRGFRTDRNRFPAEPEERTNPISRLRGIRRSTSLKRNRGSDAKLLAFFGGHGDRGFNFRRFAHRLPRTPFVQNGISSTVSSEFGGVWRRGLGALELRLRERFREWDGSEFGADS